MQGFLPYNYFKDFSLIHCSFSSTHLTTKQNNNHKVYIMRRYFIHAKIRPSYFLCWKSVVLMPKYKVKGRISNEIRKVTGETSAFIFTFNTDSHDSLQQSFSLSLIYVCKHPPIPSMLVVLVGVFLASMQLIYLFDMLLLDMLLICSSRWQKQKKKEEKKGTLKHFSIFANYFKIKTYNLDSAM